MPALFSKELAVLESVIDDIKAVDVMNLAQQTRSLTENVAVNPAFNTLLNNLRSKLQEFSDSLTLSCFVHADSTRQGPAYNKGKIK